MSTRVFISYRRSDSAAASGRLYDTLVSALGGEDAIFVDVDDIPIGANFRSEIVRAIEGSAAVLVVVGQDWLASDESGRARIEDPSDPVRLELESALERAIPVIPVLVDDAVMPPRSVLPESVAELADLNAASLGHRSWRADCAGLLTTIQHIRAVRVANLAERALQDGELAVAERHLAAVDVPTPLTDRFGELRERLASARRGARANELAS
ncbi:MAG: toll/interleukin-1 receptor domain-containing protein, partial [Actinomycetota bacterium]